jgi:cupin fold WbuC family metalloprotein
MDYTIIDEDLLNVLLQKASQSERYRYAYDLRNSEEDTSQRMLNTLLPDTVVPIHRHEDTSETIICIKGRLDVIFYNHQPDDSFEEIQRVALDPSQGCYGVQIPKGSWHTVEVHEPSVIFEGKDGAYKG